MLIPGIRGGKRKIAFRPFREEHPEKAAMNLSSRGALREERSSRARRGSSSEKEKIRGTLPRYVEKCRVSSRRSSSRSGNPTRSFAAGQLDPRPAEARKSGGAKSPERIPRKNALPVRHYRLCPRTAAGTSSRRGPALKNSWRIFATCRDL